MLTAPVDWRHRLHAFDERLQYSVRRGLRLARNPVQRRTAFVLGSGPSLGGLALERFASEPTVMVNSALYQVDALPFTPTWLFLNDRTMGHNERARARLAEVRAAGRTQVVVNARHMPEEPGGFTPPRAICGDACCCAAAFLLAQGFDTVVFFGMDMNYRTAGGEGGTLTHRTGLHFAAGSGEAFGGEAWLFPDMEIKESALRSFLRHARRQGACVLNATRETQTNVFPRNFTRYARFYR